jgi:hypothetical protein
MFRLPDNTKGHMDDLGRHGWEMVSCTWFDAKSGRATFKRPTTRIELGRIGDAFGVRYVDGPRD